MQETYVHGERDAHWQRVWEETCQNEASSDRSRKRFSIVPMFPYPSGKLHMGHVRAYSITDVVARYRRRLGENVLHTFGWDAFGLPAENEAIARNIPPQQSIQRNISVARSQIKAIGISYDWSREISTCDPSFDRFTQWIFLRLLKAGLAYRALAPVNWCGSCMTTLANEQVTGGKCERCDTPVETRLLTQWFFRVTAYARQMEEALDSLTGWPVRIRKMQKTWIGYTEDESGPHFHIRDWLISRQRYWGSPIPVVYCDRCELVPLPDEELPVILPVMEDFRPKGKPPLATVREWVNTRCPKCGGPARRETDTMDTFVPSAWYYLRYLSPDASDAPAKPEDMEYWMPLDLYVGGPEHATVHLIYTRFMMRALHSLGVVPFDEPIRRLFVQGVVTRGGAKMSKSKGNAVSQDEIVSRYGADTARLYALFLAPPEQDVEWSDAGIEGVARFLNRVWRLGIKASPRVASTAAERTGAKWRHDIVWRVTSDLEQFRFNTAISSLMQLANKIEDGEVPYDEGTRTLVELLSPFAPHLTEELWHRWGCARSIHQCPWPRYDTEMLREAVLEIPVQVDGKVRAVLTMSASCTDDEVLSLALAQPNVIKHLGGQKPRDSIVVRGKIVSVLSCK